MKTIKVSVSTEYVDTIVYQVDDSINDDLTGWFSGWFEKYANESVEKIGAAAFKDKEFIRFGWSRLRVRVSDKTITLEAPDFKAFPVEWKKDLTIVLQIAVLHNQVPESFKLQTLSTFLDDTAVVGEAFDKFPMFMLRSEQVEGAEGHSGWFMASMSEDVDSTDESKFKIMSLYEAAVQAPHILEYLAMPIGVQVVFKDSKPTVLHNNEDLSVVEGHYQPV